MIIIDHTTFFHINVPFDRYFKAKILAIKSLDPDKSGSVRWIHDKKVWWVSGALRPQVTSLATKFRATIQPYIIQTPQLVGEVGELPDLDFELPLKATLRPYQRQGIARSMELRRVLNGDDMGLGKTLQSIGTIVGLHEKGQNAFPCLCIVPAVAKENWRREWDKWSNHRAMILTDSCKNTWMQYYKAGIKDVFITNYESLKKYFVESMPAKGKVRMSKDIVMRECINLFNSVIIDESHRIKSPATLQTKLCARIAHKKENIILLSGTPVMNKPIDLYTQLVIMGQIQHFGGTRKAFVDRYCDGGTGASNLRELNYLLKKHCFFRREKKDVLTELPEKQRQVYICDITTRREYEFAENNFIKFLQGLGKSQTEINKSLRAEALSMMNQLSQIAARGKLNEIKEFTDEVLASGQKLILFCNLKHIVNELKKIYPDAVSITGDDVGDKRQANIDKFQEDPDCKLIICNLKAAGVAVTLTASSQVGFIEFPWTAALCQQAEDRAHRMGQLNKNGVMCTYFLGKNTIDEKRYAAILEKAGIANAITGATDDMEMSMVDNVISLFQNNSYGRETSAA